MLTWNTTQSMHRPKTLLYYLYLHYLFFSCVCNPFSSARKSFLLSLSCPLKFYSIMWSYALHTTMRQQELWPQTWQEVFSHRSPDHDVVLDISCQHASCNSHSFLQILLCNTEVDKCLLNYSGASFLLRPDLMNLSFAVFRCSAGPYRFMVSKQTFGHHFYLSLLLPFVVHPGFRSEVLLR